MPYFDRFDICEAHKVLEVDWNVGGWVRERASNVRRRESTGVQLHRMSFESPVCAFEDLSENGQEIYRELCARYGFDFNESEG